MGNRQQSKDKVKSQKSKKYSVFKVFILKTFLYICSSYYEGQIDKGANFARLR